MTDVAVRGLPFYAALSYNGQVTFEPSDPLDAPITAAASTNVATWDLDQLSARMPRTIAMFEAVGYFVGCAAADWDEPHDQDMLAALVDGWPGTAREVGQQSLPEIATRLTHRRDALSHENRQFASVASMSSLPRSPGAERSDRNRTTRRHPVGGSSLARATLLARARSAED